MLRLTLRTLLAYLDDTLSPAQARDIGQQIAEEPSINDLMVRIRNVMRRRRLLADSPDPDHADVDPNDVAEYLDSVLSPARVAELEKRILENDLDLAEVASVHQILSLVLGKPSEVSSSAKERAYRLIKSKSRVHTLLEPIGPKRSPTEAKPAEPSGQFNPNSNGMPPSRFGTSLVVVTLLILLGVAVYFTVTNPKERPLPPLPGPGGEVASATVGDSKVDAGKAEPTKPVDLAEATATPNETPAAPAPEVSAPAEKTTPASDASLPKDELDAVPEIDNVKPKVTPEPKEGDAKEVEEAASALIPPVTPSADEKEAMEAPAAAEAGTDVAKADLVPALPGDVDPKAAEAEIDSFVPLATYTSPTGMLLRRSKKGWERLQPQSQIFASELIANPPPGRSKIEFPTGLVLEMVGQAHLLLAFDPTFDVDCINPEGDLILTSGKEPTHTKFDVNGTAWILGLNSDGAKVAIKSDLVVPVRLESTRPAVWRLTITTIAGNVDIARDSQTVKLPVGKQLALRSDESTFAETTDGLPPDWVTAAPEPTVDRMINRLSDEVPLGPGPSNRFRELVEDNNKEIRLYAIGSLASMGEVDALVDFLRHPKYEPVRSACFQSLRIYAREGGDNLRAVQSSLTRMYRPDVATSLLELIVGFPNSDQWNVILFKRLIERLDAEELPVREAAIKNLAELTGKTFNYSADAASAQRRTAIGRWNKWMESQTDATLRDLKPTKT